jgi:hypothetical protein
MFHGPLWMQRFCHLYLALCNASYSWVQQGILNYDRKQTGMIFQIRPLDSRNHWCSLKSQIAYQLLPLVINLHFYLSFTEAWWQRVDYWLPPPPTAHRKKYWNRSSSGKDWPCVRAMVLTRGWNWCSAPVFHIDFGWEGTMVYTVLLWELGPSPSIYAIQIFCFSEWIASCCHARKIVQTFWLYHPSRIKESGCNQSKL